MRQSGWFLASALSLLALPAMANTELPPRATVAYGDLNLSTQAGASALRSRIDRAIVAISGDQTPIGSLIPSSGLSQARERGREQADALIAAARGCNSSP